MRTKESELNYIIRSVTFVKAHPVLVFCFQYKQDMGAEECKIPEWK